MKPEEELAKLEIEVDTANIGEIMQYLMKKKGVKSIESDEYKMESLEVTPSREWEYYYLDESDAESYATGLFQLKRSDISEEKPITETVNLGAINLDFRGNQLVGIEIFQDAEQVITPSIREGSIDQPKSLEITSLSESAQSFVNKNKENREKNFL